MWLSIFLHSIRLVFNNFAVALRISVPLMIVVVVGAIGSGFLLATGGVSVAPRDVTTAIVHAFPGPAIVYLIALVIASLWVAVAWHRVVLLDEAPGPLLPTWRGDRIFAYFIKSLLISLAIVLAMTGMGIVVTPIWAVTHGSLTIVLGMTGIDIVVTPIGAATHGSWPVLIALSLALSAVGVLISYRLSPMLPAVAIGEQLTIGEAWQATKAASGQILILAVVSVLVGEVINLPIHVLPANLVGSLLSMVWSAGVTWLTTMVGVSILTTLYGHFVQGRALSGGAARPE